MKTKVYACFTGLGKTYASKVLQDSIDLESTLFKWIYKNEDDVESLKGSTNRELNKDWPNNYIDAILSSIGKFKYIFISLNVPEVFEKLENLGVEYKIILPFKENKISLLKRLEERNNNQTFINSIDEKFDEIIDYYINFKNVIYLTSNQFLLDYIKNQTT